MKIKFTCLVSAILLVSSGQPAFAHAQLTTSSPSQNQIVKVMPRMIWLEFDGDLMLFGDKNPNEIKIFDSKQNRIDVGGAIVGGARITTKLKSMVRAGKYEVRYRIVSEDGHPVEGSFFFTYKPK